MKLQPAPLVLLLILSSCGQPDGDLDARVATLETDITSLQGQNHDRYEDAEAVTAMGVVDPTNALNHARYVDGDAVTAMGTEEPTNPLNHLRYQDADSLAAVAAEGYVVGSHFEAADAVAALVPHTSVTDAHHPRYADGESLSAVAAAGYVAGPHFTATDVVTAMTPHTSDPAGHHSRYTNAEAVTAVGPHFTGDYSDLSGQPDLSGYLTGELDPGVVTHAAIGDAHHSPYTNAEAVTAVGPHFTGDYADLSNQPDLSGYLTGETDPDVGANTPGYLSRWDGSSLVTSSIYDDGNVGIGTNSPVGDLDVTSTCTGAPTVDVSQTSSNGSLPPPATYQSFTATMSGDLVQLWLWCVAVKTGAATLTLYPGENLAPTAGDEVKTYSVTFACTAGNEWQAIDLSGDPLAVTATQQYTYGISMSLALGVSSTNPYAGGANSWSAPWDATFETVVATSSVGSLLNVNAGGGCGVGVGTTTPQATLHVAGSTQVDANLKVQGLFAMQHATGGAPIDPISGAACGDGSAALNGHLAAEFSGLTGWNLCICDEFVAAGWIVLSGASAYGTACTFP